MALLDLARVSQTDILRPVTIAENEITGTKVIRRMRRYQNPQT